jgi:hypothetical protein
VRDKHLTRLLQLAEQCREYFHPFDLDFTSCPVGLRPYLLCYERARDDNDIRERAAFIRSGSIAAPGYWSPCPDFGWSAWPGTSFLAIDAQERARRLGLPPPSPDPWIAALPLLGKGATQLVLRVDDSKSREELIAAFAALLDAHGIGRPSRPPSKTGRNAPRDRLETQMLGLALVRLRKHFTAGETMILLEGTGWAGSYSEETSLDRAYREAKRDQCAFSLLAREAMDNGAWFFPFGNTFLNI